MSAIIKVLSNIKGFDNELLGRFWKLRDFEENIIGYGIDSWSEYEAKGVEVVFRVFADTMEIIRDESLSPFDAMSLALERSHSFTEEKKYEIISGFIECETLAAFFYWCPIENKENE